MEDESILEFNFWPSFADLMLSLVMVMVITMFTFVFYLSLNNFDLKKVEDNQMTVIEKISEEFGTGYKLIDKSTFGITLSNKNSFDIKIMNDAKVQQVTFSTLILFTRNEYALNENGKSILRKFGKTLKGNLSRIQEIQIQGHADSNKTTRYNSNLELAALRSMAVFEFFQNDVGIDPAQSLMSITSFGEYKPVNRHKNDSTYSFNKILAENDTQPKRDVNRRIEILLFYK